MIKSLPYACCLMLLLLCASCTSGNGRAPSPGVELSKIDGISLIRLSEPKDEGHGRFELVDEKQYVLEAFNIDATSLIDLIVPNYRVSIRCKMPVGRYDFHCETEKFPSNNPVMQRYAIQKAALNEIQRAFKIKINMDVAKRTVIVTD